MDAAQRRETIQKLLRESREPVSAASIAARVHVSRQIIVGDIALLRAGGADIQATPRGYVLQSQDAAVAGPVYTIACRHNRANLAEELYAVFIKKTFLCKLHGKRKSCLTAKCGEQTVRFFFFYNSLYGF